MPNPGFLRYSVFAVAAGALVYDFLMGTTTDETTKQHIANELVLAYSGLAALYSKLVPSKP